MELPLSSPINDARASIRQDVVDAYASYFLFNDRVRRLRFRIQAMSFLGLVAPLLVGAAATSYGFTSNVTVVFIALAAVANIILAPLSLWALISKWDDQLTYSIGSAAENRKYWDMLRTIYDDKSIGDDEANKKTQQVRQLAAERNKTDDEQAVSEREKRMGHRAALRQMRLPCIECKQIPTTIKPTKCSICGSFSNWRI
jgi:mobilome CxxCx(11)CxxC protein